MVVIDPNLPITITAVASGIAAVLGAWNAVHLSKIKKTGEETQKTGEETHALSNGAMGEQLRVNAITMKAHAAVLHRIALLTGHEADEAAAAAVDIQAEAAQNLYVEHMERQVAADATTKGD